MWAMDVPQNWTPPVLGGRPHSCKGWTHCAGKGVSQGTQTPLKWPQSSQASHIEEVCESPNMSGKTLLSARKSLHKLGTAEPVAGPLSTARGTRRGQGTQRNSKGHPDWQRSRALQHLSYSLGCSQIPFKVIFSMGAGRRPGWKIIKSKEKWKEGRAEEEDLAKTLGWNVQLGSCLAKLKNTVWEIHLVKKRRKSKSK